MPINNDVIKANKKYEGQICAICKKEIYLGDLIHICPDCQSINHEDCWQNDGGCSSLSCNSLSSSPNNSSFNNNYQQNSSMGHENNFQTNSTMSRPIGGYSQNDGFQQSNGFQQAGINTQNLVPCRFCKEPIMRGARKCKHCGEYQRDEDRNNSAQFGKNDDSFSIADVFAILCCPSLAGIIVGTVYCSRYEVARGVRVLKYSIIWSIVSSVLWVFMNIMVAIASKPH